MYFQNKKLFLYLNFFLFFFSYISLHSKEEINIFAFRSYKDLNPKKMTLVGEVQNKTKETISKKTEVLGEYDLRNDRLTIKLVSHKGIKVGDKLFVVEKKTYHNQFRDALIIGELEVTSIFYSHFYGSWALLGKGILMRARKGHFVLRPESEKNKSKAFEVKRKGDFYINTGQKEKGIQNYLKAIQIDSSLPEAYASLANVYFQDFKRKNLVAIDSILYFEKAWKYRKNFYYLNDKIRFFYHYISILEHNYKLIRLEASRSENTVKNLEHIIEIANEAISMDKSQERAMGAYLAEAHYERMLYYENQSNAEERKEYDKSKIQTDIWLKKLLKKEQKTAKMLRLAILFYAYRYTELRLSVPKEAKLKREFYKLITDKLAPYYQFYLNPKKENYDPKIDKVLRNLKRKSNSRLGFQKVDWKLWLFSTLC